MELFGRQWTRRELAARIGRLEQVGGIRRGQWGEGPEAAVGFVQVRTGAGLAYNVLPSRALDISLATFGDAPLSWQSPAGDVHPAYYDSDGAAWLRTATGGLLMTCGLSYAGAPGEDEGQQFGLHGRVHHLPARQVVAEGRWLGDEYEMRIAGVVDETAVFGDKLRLTRTIRSRLGVNRIEIRDIVENLGFSPAPHMILYHFNFGFPLIDERTRVQIPSQKVIPRDEGVPVTGHDRWVAPQPSYGERVYYHELDPAADEMGITIHNPNFPLPGGPRPVTVTLSWSPQQLPQLVQWYMPGEGEHVLGLEPANCLVEGRAAERERGTLVVLEPGESRTYELALEVTAGE